MISIRKFRSIHFHAFLPENKDMFDLQLQLYCRCRGYGNGENRAGHAGRTVSGSDYQQYGSRNKLNRGI